MRGLGFQLPQCDQEAEKFGRWFPKTVDGQKVSFEYVKSSENEELNEISNQGFQDRMEASGKQNKSLIPRTLSRSSTGQRIPPSLGMKEIVNSSPFSTGGTQDGQPWRTSVFASGSR